MTRIVLHTNQLARDLPDGIYVRWGDSRPDVLKAVIIGPQGTPYANGLFEFDMFIPDNYPYKPPLVKFITTGSGKIRFNPNLYADGKVCLSLLGTWDGRPWDPKMSSLYQVMLSMQAMIFNNEPMTNEPGFESYRGTPISAAYNRSIWSWTR
ncbi:UBC-like protein [Aulographum hederae CBS 113979]|uniref:UBC-like protein n=1 Tax=Aulographum hederae CBS 113979 TaxID=1176131 RepID=A0A6G1H620_9PEZI|nr:UBC-like protein [Aulographum hederae CBS 113979]